MGYLKELRFTGKDYILLTILFLIEFTRGAFFLTYLQFYTVNYLGIAEAVALLAISAHFTIETLTKCMAGWQLDRRGHLAMIAGLVIGLSALILMKVYPVAPVLLLGSALLGLGISPIWLAVISRVAPVNCRDRASRVGVIFAIWLAGCGSGPALISYIIEYGYSLTYWILIILWTIALLVAATVRGIDADPGSHAGFSFIEEIKPMLRQAGVRKILLPSMFIQTFTAGMILPLLPLYAQNFIGLGPKQYAALILAGGGAAVISLLPMGRLANRLSLRLLISVGFASCAIFLGVFTTVHQPAHAYLLAAIVGFSYAAVLPAWNSLLAKAVPQERQATGWGVFATIEGMGVAGGTGLSSLMTSFFGLQVPILIGTATLAALSCFYMLYPIDKLFTNPNNPGD